MFINEFIIKDNTIQLNEAIEFLFVIHLHPLNPRIQ